MNKTKVKVEGVFSIGDWKSKETQFPIKQEKKILIESWRKYQQQ